MTASPIYCTFLNEQNTMEKGAITKESRTLDNERTKTSDREPLKAEEGDETGINEENVIATEGIFAHATSLEDSITDEVGALDIHRSSAEEDGTARGSIMKSSIHELQGDDAIVQLTGDSQQTSKQTSVESDER